MPLDFADASFDVVMAMHSLELFDEQNLDDAIAEVKRSSKDRVMALVRTCGSQAIKEGCAAMTAPGVKTVQSRDWWIAKFKEHGLEMEWFPHVFEQRPCNEIDKPSRHKPYGDDSRNWMEHKPKGMTWGEARAKGLVGNPRPKAQSPEPKIQNANPQPPTPNPKPKR